MRSFCRSHCLLKDLIDEACTVYQKSKKILYLLNHFILHDHKERFLSPHKEKKHIPSINDKSRLIPVNIYEQADHYIPEKSCLLIHGFSPLGPEDSRLEFLVSIFTFLGYRVYVPYIKDFMDTKSTPETYLDIFTTFDYIAQSHSEVRPTVFSVSFGSFLALKLATDPDRGHKISLLTLFGGFGDWKTTCEAIINGVTQNGEDFSTDSRIFPILFLHMIESLYKNRGSLFIKMLEAKVREYIHLTWNEPPSDKNKAFIPVAEKLSEDLGAEDRQTFMKGCGLLDGFKDIFISHLSDDRFRYLDSLENRNSIACPICLFHSSDDKVIPLEQYYILLDKIPSHQVKHHFITTLYTHSDKKTESSTTMLLRKSRSIWDHLKLIWFIS